MHLRIIFSAYSGMIVMAVSCSEDFLTKLSTHWQLNHINWSTQAIMHVTIVTLVQNVHSYIKICRESKITSWVAKNLHYSAFVFLIHFLDKCLPSSPFLIIVYTVASGKRILLWHAYMYMVCIWLWKKTTSTSRPEEAVRQAWQCIQWNLPTKDPPKFHVAW